MPRLFKLLCYLFLVMILLFIVNIGKTLQGTEVSTLPFYANHAGRYYLRKNLSAPPDTMGFIVNTNKVKLDLNGHIITCQGGPHSRTNGITVATRKYFKAKNGTIQHCFYGVDGRGNEKKGENYRIRRIVFRNNYFRGIRSDARNSYIRDNIILNTSGSTVYPNAFAMGIEVRGSNTLISHNIVSNTRSTGSGEGIGVAINGGGVRVVIQHNVITADQRDDHTNFGIWVGGTSFATVKHNLVNNYKIGLAGSSPTRGCFEQNVFQNTITPVYQFDPWQYWSSSCTN